MGALDVYGMDMDAVTGARSGLSISFFVGLAGGDSFPMGTGCSTASVREIES